jgi:hypothetical protein
MYDLEFNKNEDSMKLLWNQISRLGEAIERGEEQQHQQSIKKKGKCLPANE